MAVLHFYLNRWILQAVQQGYNTMPGKVKRAVEAAGWTVALLPEEERETAWSRPGYHMVLNQPVVGRDGVTLRACGWEPFWRIEETNDRWDWQLADQDFDAERSSLPWGRQFQTRWREKLFGDRPVGSWGGVFAPLQGKLLQQRHFQAASPIAMLEEVLQRWPGRPVKATLHPNESYSAEELAALERLSRDRPQFSLSTEPSDALLASCDLVVTQNSSLALKGFLLEKPAMLWARMDFHHIAASVPRQGREAAFAQVESGERPDFGRYLVWYFRQNALFAWDEDLPEAICRRLAELGWPI